MGGGVIFFPVEKSLAILNNFSVWANFSIHPPGYATAKGRTQKFLRG